MRVYLSGPTVGIPEFNFPAFHAAAASLRAQGFDVVSPAETKVDGFVEWHAHACLRADIKAMMDCDGVVLLPGWERSEWARLELRIAHRVGMTVYDLGGLVAAHVNHERATA